MTEVAMSDKTPEDELRDALEEQRRINEALQAEVEELKGAIPPIECRPWARGGEVDMIVLPRVGLTWSPWFPWSDVDDGSAPNSTSPFAAVYEVRKQDKDERLYIGETKDLSQQVRAVLVRGSPGYTFEVGEWIREHQLGAAVELRWAGTRYHKAIEHMLLERYEARHGTFPQLNMIVQGGNP